MPTFGELEEEIEAFADDQADKGAEEALPEDGAEEPFFCC